MTVTIRKATAEDAPLIAGFNVAMARESGITVRRDADLVEVLAALDLDSEIPVEAFAAVAEILSYVYQANRRMNAGQG